VPDAQEKERTKKSGVGAPNPNRPSTKMQVGKLISTQTQNILHMAGERGRTAGFIGQNKPSKKVEHSKPKKKRSESNWGGGGKEEKK